MRRAAWVGCIAATVGIAFALSCAHVPSELAAYQPAVDSPTLGLWHMDEVGGTFVGDAGPLKLHGTAGIETRTDFGRFGNARLFVRLLDSFVFMPHAAPLRARTLTVEAWIFPVSLGEFEDTPIAGRWTERPNAQSWLFSLVGKGVSSRLVNLPGPGYHSSLVRFAKPGRTMLALQLEEASLPMAFFSATEIPLKQWTHVAATYDGEIVRFWVDGRLDAQYALGGTIRDSDAPLIIGNYFDPTRLSDFAGDLRVEPGLDETAYYAFEGIIDELRISGMARDTFPEVGLR